MIDHLFGPLLPPPFPQSILMDHNLLVVPEDLCKPIKANCVEQNEAEQEDEEGEEQEDDQNCKNTVTVKAQTKRVSI